MANVLLLKMSAPCSNTLHCPFPHVQHCPPHHGRVNLHNLSDYVGLQLVEGGRIWIWISGSPRPVPGRSHGGRKLDRPQSLFDSYLKKSEFTAKLDWLGENGRRWIWMEHISHSWKRFPSLWKSIPYSWKVIPKSLQRVKNKVLAHTIKTVFYI